MKYLVALALALFMLGFALGVPLLAWGMTDWKDFFSSPARFLYGMGVGLQSLVVGLGFLRLPFSYTLGKR